MVITYQGENYVKVTAGPFTFLMDPADERSFRGAKFVLMTQNPLSRSGTGETSTLVLREPLVINHPGEYQTEGVRITGYHIGTLGHSATGEPSVETELIAYRVLMEGITLGFLGHLTELPDQKAVGGLADMDLLFIPGGGQPWLKASDAAKLVRQLAPGLVIPTLLTKKTCEGFAKELGVKFPTPAEKLVIKKKDIVPKACTVVCLAA